MPEIRKMVYANTPEVVEALKGIDVLLMVSARENPERVEEHKSFLDAAKLAGCLLYTSSVEDSAGIKKDIHSFADIKDWVDKHDYDSSIKSDFRDYKGCLLYTSY